MFRLENLRASTFMDKTFATGPGYDKNNPVAAVALPCRKALRKLVKIIVPEIGEGVFPVLDVGPYLWWDDDFVMGGNRPFIENYHKLKKPFPIHDDLCGPWSKISFSGKVPPSRASVDLTPEAWRKLGVVGTDEELKYYSRDDVSMEWFIKSEVEDNQVPEWLRIKE